MTGYTWAVMPMLGFDVESTGISAHNDRVVTMNLHRDQPGQDPQTFDWLVDPGVEIPDEAAAVHGITTDHAREHGSNPAQALFEVSARLALWVGRGFPVVAFNAAYDLTMLEAENRRHGLLTLAERLDPKPVGPIIDPHVIDKHVDKYRRGKRILTVTAEHYGIELKDAHTASADAAAAVGVARAILARYPQQFAGLSVGGLHLAQALWREQQMNSLRAYFNRAGTEHDGCDPGWPVMGDVETAERQEALL